MAADERDDGDPKEPRGERSRIPGLSAARRLVGEGGSFKEAKEVLGAVLDGSDRVKTEAVRMVGREVRTYLEGLGLKDDINHLLTHYSLEVNASFHLKPLVQPEPEAETPAQTEDALEPDSD